MRRLARNSYAKSTGHCFHHGQRVWAVASCSDDVKTLNQGSTRQEVLSGELQSGIADVADIDRSAELLIWLWDSMWGKSSASGDPVDQPPQLPKSGDTTVPEKVTGRLDGENRAQELAS